MDIDIDELDIIIARVHSPNLSESGTQSCEEASCTNLLTKIDSFFLNYWQSNQQFHSQERKY